MQEPCTVPIFSHRKLLILAVPKLWKKCQQTRRGKNSHPAERNFFLSPIIRSQETLKYNTAIFTFVGVIQLLQHFPGDASLVMLYPSPSLDPNFQKRLSQQGFGQEAGNGVLSAGRCFLKQHYRGFFSYPYSKTLLLFTPPHLGWL